MIAKLNRKNLYKISLIIWIVSSIFFGRTTIGGIIGNIAITIYSLGRITTYMLLFCTILWGGLKKKEITKAIIVLVILLLSAASSGEIVLVGVLLFVMAAKNINPDEILTVYFKIHLAVLLITVILAMTHIIDMNVMNRGPIQRYSFGFSHPNGFGSEVLTVVVCYVTKKWNKLKNYELVVITGLGCFFLQVADCRMASLVLILYVICFLTIKNIYKYKVNVVAIKNVVILIFFAVILVTVCMTFFYSDQNNVLRIVDKIFSYRFNAMHTLYKVQGIKLFGQKILDDTLIGIDNSYARVFLIGGIVPFLILIVFSVRICNIFAKRNEVKYLLAFATIILSGFIENNFFRIENNFCFLIGGAYLLSGYYKRRRKKHNDKNFIGKTIQQGNKQTGGL